MDQEQTRKPADAGTTRPAPHISMELQADSARVTNLTMEGNRLILTIEAELSSSQVKATPSAGPTPMVAADTEELPKSSVPPETPAASAPTGSTVPPARYALELEAERHLEPVFSLGSEELAKAFSRPGESGGAGIAPPPPPPSSVIVVPPAAAPAEPPAPPFGSGATTIITDMSRMRSAAPKIEPEQNSPATQPESAAPVEPPLYPEGESDSMDDTSDLLVPPGGVNNHLTENETDDPSLAALADKADPETSTQAITYDELAAIHSDLSMIADDQDEENASHTTGTEELPEPPSVPAPAAVDEQPHVVEDEMDEAPSVPPPTPAFAPEPPVFPEEPAKPAGSEGPAEQTEPAAPAGLDRIMTVAPADLEDDSVLSEESTAVGGDRHGEPLPSMAYGYEKPSVPAPEQPAAPVVEEAPRAATGEAAPTVAPFVSEPIPEPAPPPQAVPELVAEQAPEPAPEPAPPLRPFVAESAAEKPPAAPEVPAPAAAPLPEEPAADAPQPALPPEIERPLCPPPAPEPDASPDDPTKGPVGGTTVLIRYTCPKCKTQGMQAVDKVGTVVNCSNCGKAMRLVMKK